MESIKKTFCQELNFLFVSVLIIAAFVPLMMDVRPVAAFDCGSVTEIPEAECEALVALYDSTDGDNWVDNSGWLQTDTPCSWRGVRCFDGHISQLSLPDNQLRGSVPSQIGDLTKLQSLYLSRNQLISFPSEIGSLVNLWELNLRTNQLISLPPAIGNLAGLKYLYLNDNQLSSLPPEIGNLANLQYLSLDDNQLNSLPPEIGNLANLQYLSLKRNRLSSLPPEIGKLVNLKSFKIYGNQLSSLPSEIGNLANLLELILSGNRQLIGPLPENLTNLSLSIFRFYDTNLCEPTDQAFQDWLDSIASLSRTGLKCGSEPSPFCASVTEIPKAECEVLLALYESTDGDSWRLDDYSMTYDVCNWNEINCSNGHVTKLLLSTVGLSGNIPPELSNLENLQLLILSYNQLNGSIPPELGNFKNLQYLFLDENQLSGNIPPELGNLENLKYLSLGKNQLSGSIPLSLTNLTRLEHFYFNDTNLCMPMDATFQEWSSGVGVWGMGICGEYEALIAFYNSTGGENWTNHTNWLEDNTFCKWHGVECLGDGSVLSLSLGYNNLKGMIPSELDNLKNLQYLSLHHNQLTGTIPSQLSNLGNLQQLLLNGNKLNGPLPKNLTELTQLKDFSFYNNDLCEPKDPTFQDWLSGIDSLYSTGIECSFCDSVTEIPKTECEALVALYNSTDGDNWTDNSGWLDANTPCSWAGVECGWLDASMFCSLAGIECNDGYILKLHLLNNQLNGDIPPELGNLDKLQSLILSINQLSGSIPPELGKLTNLQTLWLIDNQLSGSIPPELGNLTNLRSFSLSDNQLSDTIPSELGDLTNLQSFNLTDNQLSGSIPDELGKLVNLKHLLLWSNQLSGTIPPELGDLTNLQSLRLSDNQLSGSIPHELGKLANLQGLDLSSNQLNSSLPRDLMNLTLEWFRFYDTDLCEPADTAFQDWLAGIDNLGRTHVKCESPSFCDSITEIPKTECEALVALYNSTNGDNWTDRTGWLETDPPCSWYGVVCNDGHITELSMINNLLTGDIPPELSQLTSLQELDLCRNNLTGDIPPELAGKFKVCPPVNPTINSPSTTSISLNWTAVNRPGDITGYAVYHSTTSGGPYTLFATTPDGTTENITITGLKPDTEYFFSLRTVAADSSHSEYTEEVSVTTRMRPKKAIIVAGGGDYPNNGNWTGTQVNAGVARNVLSRKGYPEDAVSYLRPGFNDDLKTDLQERIQAGSNDAQELLLYMIDHGGMDLRLTEQSLAELKTAGVPEDIVAKLDMLKDKVWLTWDLKEAIGEDQTEQYSQLIMEHSDKEYYFLLDNTISPAQKLKPATLNTWLDDLQETMPGRLISVYDACHSGAFIGATEKERVVITATEKNENAIISGPCGQESFSWGLWAPLSLYENIIIDEEYDCNTLSMLGAFNCAKHWIEVFASYIPNVKMTPCLDADGDGDPNNGLDYYLADKIIIGNENAHARSSRMADATYRRPHVGNMSDEQILHDEASATLQAWDIYSDHPIENVVASIVRPDFEVKPGEPISLPYVLLLDPDNDGIYEGEYDAFDVPGTYTIIIYAMDTNGIRSFPKKTTVTRTGGEISPDSYEAYDTSTEARFIDEPRELNFHDAGDEDWGMINGSAGETYAIETTELGSNCDTVIELYGDSNSDNRRARDDRNNMELLTSVNAKGFGEDELLEWLCPKDAIYYVKIRHSNPDISGENTEYTLRFRSPRDGHDAYEPDDESGQARVIQISVPQHHNLHNAEDTDWVKFYVTAETFYKIRALNLESDCYISMQLYNGSQTELASNSFGVEYLDYTFSQEGIYYLKIAKKSFGSCVNPTYDLRIDGPFSPLDGTIEGTVKDACSEESIGDIDVRIKTTGSGSAMSLENGTYIMYNPPGTYGLTAEAEGYEAFTASVSLGEGEVISQSIEMLPTERGTYYRDADNDGYGDSTDSTQACTQPDGYVENSTDCNDGDPNEHPNQTWYKDADDDGYSDGMTTTSCTRPANHKLESELTATSGDCNDSDPSIHPSAPESCNGKDDNCNSQTDEGVMTTYYKDVDNDGHSDGTKMTSCTSIAGYKPTSGLTAISGDCNDSDPSIHPNAPESCNGKDDNCNSQTDEGVTITFCRDADSDGYGNPNDTTQACSQPAGYLTDNTDCNDSDPSEHPGQTWHKDTDNDGYSDDTTTTSCAKPAGYKLASELTGTLRDCNDSDSSIHPNASETCNETDDNCNGETDEDVTTPYYLDADQDGYGNPDEEIHACMPPENYVSNASDCKDSDPLIHPDASETCNGKDDDCDEEIDEEVKTTYHRDGDEDGYGDPKDTVQACTQLDGYVEDDTDCNDDDPKEHPNQIWYKDADDDGYSDGITETSCERPANYKTESELFTISGDCDDSDPNVYPNQVWYKDADDDGYSDGTTMTSGNCDASADESSEYAVPPGYKMKSELEAISVDCDDDDNSIHPDASELCDGTDHDCDGKICLPGDIDGNESLDLQDAILALKILIGADIGDPSVNKDADVNQDGMIGLPEVIYILKDLADINT